MILPIARRHRLALSASAIALAAFAASPVSAQNRWTKDPAVVFHPGDGWGPNVWGKGGPRLACGPDRTLYLNLDDSLWVGADGGASWRIASPPPPDNRFGNPALAIGHDGNLIWGGGLSRDQGRAWTPFGIVEDSSLNATAFGELDDGTLLAGGLYDQLYRSADTGRSWGRVHMGNTYATIDVITPGNGKWVFAAPHSDDLLASRDGGKTWVKAGSLAQGGPPERMVAKYLACKPADQLLFALTDPETSDPVLEEIHWADDSLQVISHQATRTFPDSQVSAFAMPPVGFLGPQLWVGTWGQGVWASSDWGKSWSPRNDGLGDLHVESLVIEPGGMVHALTLDGLYSMTPATALAPVSRLRQAPSRLRFSGASVLFGQATGVPFTPLFRADGRSVPREARSRP